jgi:hypothetical protein
VPTLKEVAKDRIALALNRKNKKDEELKETGAGGGAEADQLLKAPPKKEEKMPGFPVSSQQPIVLSVLSFTA